jgi:hypothetical protein
MGEDYIMPLILNSASSTKVSPPPINKVIVENGIPTQTFIRYLLDLRKTSLSDTLVIDEIIEEIIKLQKGTLVINTSVNVSLSVQSQTVLADSSAGGISITLPPPAQCFSDNRSLKIAINKIDTSANKVTILPNGSEEVIGEVNQELVYDGEILNFITDGTDWFLYA